MQLVERHIIKASNSIWQELDTLCFLSKNLYNYANYLVRQEFITNSKYLNYYDIYALVKTTVDFQALPAKVSQQVLKLLDKNWKSFFKANQAYKQNPSKFLGRPKLPKYKDKIKGRNTLIYNNQAISRKWFKKGIINLSGTNIYIPTKVDNVAQVRVIPKSNQYLVEIIYEKQEETTVVNSQCVASIDIGVNNLATLTSNQLGFNPILINGRPLKAINQFYNKTKAKLQSQLKGKTQTSKRIQRLTNKRNNQVDNYLHQASRWIINYLDKRGISKLIVGKNSLGKQSINIGKKNNQTFLSIPHCRFIDMLIYKGKLKGIEVICVEESYTSQASFLDLDIIPTYKKNDQTKYNFSGKRISRGLYKSKSGRKISSDINGSYNILRKVIPECFNNRGIERVVVRAFSVIPNKTIKYRS